MCLTLWTYSTQQLLRAGIRTKHRPLSSGLGQGTWAVGARCSAGEQDAEGTAFSLKHRVPESFLGKTSLCSWNCPAVFAGLRAHTEVKGGWRGGSVRLEGESFIRVYKIGLCA